MKVKGPPIIQIEVLRSVHSPKTYALCVEDKRFGPGAGPWKVERVFKVRLEDLRQHLDELHEQCLPKRHRYVAVCSIIKANYKGEKARTWHGTIHIEAENLKDARKAAAHGMRERPETGIRKVHSVSLVKGE